MQTIDLPRLIENAAIKANADYRAGLLADVRAGHFGHFAALELAYLEQLVAHRAACTTQAALDALARRTADETRRLAWPPTRLSRSIIDAIESRVTVTLDEDGDVCAIESGYLVLDITNAVDALAWEFDERVTVHVAAKALQMHYRGVRERMRRDGELGEQRMSAWITAVKIVDGRCIVVVEVGEED